MVSGKAKHLIVICGKKSRLFNRCFVASRFKVKVLFMIFELVSIALKYLNVRIINGLESAVYKQAKNLGPDKPEILV